MLNSILALSLSVHYAVPVQPILYYSYGLDVRVFHRYASASLFRVGGSGDYSFTSLSAGGGYTYRIFYAGLEMGVQVRSREDAREISLGPSVYGGLVFGSRWNMDIGLKFFPGRTRNLSFLLIGIGYIW